MDNYESKNEVLSQSENFQKFNKYDLCSTLVLIYTLILVLLIWFHKKILGFKAVISLGLL